LDDPLKEFQTPPQDLGAIGDYSVVTNERLIRRSKSALDSIVITLSPARSEPGELLDACLTSRTAPVSREPLAVWKSEKTLKPKYKNLLLQYLRDVKETHGEA